MNRRNFLGTTGPALLASSLFGPTLGRAETYPSRPIRIVVPGAAAGVLDVVARRLTDPIGRITGRIERKLNLTGSDRCRTVYHSAPMQIEHVRQHQRAHGAKPGHEQSPA